MVRSSLSGALAVTALMLLVPASAGAQVLRFSTTAPGTVIGTGNTLGLSKAVNQNGPGTADSIGTFTSLNPLSVDNSPLNAANPWGLGTTNDWTKNGSNAKLTVPQEGVVLYAELVWGGSYNYGGQDVTAFLNSPVMLTGGANSMSIAPDPATALTIAQIAQTGFAVNYYMRSADVTAFVKAAGSGIYSVTGVPATEVTTINSLNAAGWTLTVAVRDPGQPTRNLSVFVGGSFVDENSQQDYTVSGFCAPPAGVVKGTAVISAIEGDANLTGDQFLIAPSMAGPFVNLEGPNNPANNFFCSQINDSKGNVDTSGTFGLANQNAINGTNIAGGRQGWDVTTIPLSSQDGQLVNGQTSAVLRTITTGDSYVPIQAAFAIDVNSPVFSAGGTALKFSKDPVSVGDKIQVMLDLNNTGQVTAKQVALSLPLDAGLKLSSFTTDGKNGDINGNPVNDVGLKAGVDEGDLPAGQTRHVVLGLDVTGPPAGALYLFNAKWDYTFQVCVGGNNLPESFVQSGTLTYDANGSTAASGSGAGGAGSGAGAGGGASSGSAGNGGAGNGSASGGGSSGSTSSGGSGDNGESSGCGCSMPGREESPWALGALAMVAAVGVIRSRRRRDR